MRRIAVITGSRADHSPLANVIRLLGDNCIHIQTEGLYGHEEFIRESLERVKPDFVVLLGDRYETLVTASVCALLTIPIVHLHGGEITEGAVDDGFRHAISKLAYYHFVCHAKYKGRLERLGESPERIFVTGALGVDALVDEPMTKEECEEKLGMKFLYPFAVCCIHPETLGNGINLSNLMDGYKTFIVSGANIDIGNEKINEFWETCSKGTYYSKDFPQRLWLSLMYHADVLIGNSSSFIFEGMTLGKKVIMIGDRQKGRYEDAVMFFKRDAHAFGLPGEVSPRIVELLMTLEIPQKPRKEFYDFDNRPWQHGETENSLLTKFGV